MKHKLLYLIVSIFTIAFLFTTTTHSAEKKVESDFKLSKILIGKWKSEISDDNLEIRGTNTYTADGKLFAKGNLNFFANKA